MIIVMIIVMIVKIVDQFKIMHKILDSEKH